MGTNRKILLISEEYVKQQSIVMQNVEDGFFRSAIFEASDIYLQPVICEELYEVIISEFNDYKDALASGTTEPIEHFVEPRILDLVDNHLNLIILYYTLYNASYSFSTKVTNKGTVEQHSTNSVNADRKMIDDMRRDWKQKAEFYIVEATKFLIKNINDFPEYENCVDDNNCELPTSSSTITGLYLGPSI